MDKTFEQAKEDYKLGNISEEVWIYFLSEELAKERTRKGINRFSFKQRQM